MPAEEEQPKQLAADPIFESLAGAILRGKFASGTALPPERELAALFNVSRLIVRQALHRLREMGMVRGSQGGQTIVLDAEQWNDPRIVALMMQLAPGHADEQYVFERQLLAGSMLLTLAELRITDAEIDEIEQIIARAAVSENPDADLEAGFWLAIAKASRNRIMFREARWWFEMIDRQPERRQRLFFSKPELRIGLYQILIAQLRQRQGVPEIYLQAVRALLSAPPEPPEPTPPAAAAKVTKPRKRA